MASRDLIDNAFPSLQLSPTVSSLRPSATSSKHADATWQLASFETLADSQYHPQPAPSVLWHRAGVQQSGRLNWTSETTIQIYVENAMFDCIFAARLNHSLLMERGLSVDASCPDGWVFRIAGPDGVAIHMPIGVVEVKKPSTNSTGSQSASRSSVHDADHLDDAAVLGQIYDYLCLMRLYYGLTNAFGILTNYVEWRIVWLPDTDNVAQAKQVPLPQVIPSTKVGTESVKKHIIFTISGLTIH